MRMLHSQPLAIDADDEDDMGRTALHYAAQLGNLEVCEELLNHMPDIMPVKVNPCKDVCVFVCINVHPTVTFFDSHVCCLHHDPVMQSDTDESICKTFRSDTLGQSV